MKSFHDIMDGLETRIELVFVGLCHAVFTTESFADSIKIKSARKTRAKSPNLEFLASAI